MNLKKVLAAAGDVALVAAFLVILFTVVVAPILGWQVNNVLTGSMVPTLRPGDLFLCVKADIKEVEAGDIIAFYAPDTGKTPVVHRAVEVNYRGEEVEITTKGDAVEQPDKWTVTKDNFIGKAYGRVPLVGYLGKYLGSKTGIVVGVGLLLILGVLTMIDIAKEPQSKRLKFSMRRTGRFPKYAALTLVGVALLAWLIMSRGVMIQDLPMTQVSQGGYRTEKQVENKGLMPLQMVFTSGGELSDENFVLMPGEKKTITVDSEKEAATLSSGAFFPLLPLSFTHLLFEWQPHSVAVIMALEVLLMGALIILLKAKFTKRKIKRRRLH